MANTNMTRATATPGTYVKVFHTPYGTTDRKYLGLGCVRTAGRGDVYVWLADKLVCVGYDAIEAVTTEAV